MWRSIRANMAHQPVCLWEERTKVIQTNGLPSYTTAQYTDIGIYFVPLPERLIREESGYYNIREAEAIVVAEDLSDNDITPSTHTSYIRRNDELWRVVRINDLSENLHMYCYSLGLERVELNDQ